MKTYPMYREDGKLHAFEFPNSRITVRRLRRLIEVVPGVTDVALFGPSGENRIRFKLGTIQCVVWEPFGDNDRFWVGPSEPQVDFPDLEDIHSVIQSYQPPLGIGIPWLLAAVAVSVVIYVQWVNWGVVTQCAK